MITFSLPKETILDMVKKLDQVAGTRALCNFFENGVRQVDEKEAAAALENAIPEVDSPAKKTKK